jgi:hypothetical protein
MSKTAKFLMSGLALAILLAAGTPAQAGTLYNGYLCAVGLNPTALGSAGYVFVNVYSGPDCTGTFLGGPVYFCSTGASSPLCNNGFLYTEAQLMGLYNAATRAIEHNVRAQVWTDSTCGTPAQCGAYINFTAQ